MCHLADLSVISSPHCFGDCGRIILLMKLEVLSHMPYYNSLQTASHNYILSVRHLLSGCVCVCVYICMLCVNVKREGTLFRMAYALLRRECYTGLFCSI